MQSTLDRAAAESNPARARHIRHEITEHYKDTTESNADETQQKKKEKRTTMLMICRRNLQEGEKLFLLHVGGQRIHREYWCHLPSRFCRNSWLVVYSGCQVLLVAGTHPFALAT